MQLNNVSANTSSRTVQSNQSDDDNSVDTPVSNLSNINTQLPLATAEPAANDQSIELGVGSSGQIVNALQDSLVEAGYNPGTPDGRFGDNTLTALQNYQQDRINSLETTLSNGPPPSARSELQRQINGLTSELSDNVAGVETLSQLGVETAGEVEEQVVSETEAVTGIGRGDSGAEVRALQEDINATGFNTGVPDGAFGGRTASGLKNFQESRIEYLQGMQQGPIQPTDHALIDFQITRLQQELDAGVAGPETQSQLDVALSSPTNRAALTQPAGGPETGLTEADFQSAADQLGVDVATVKAIAEVESARAGFLPSGDPSILFEAHIFGSWTGDVYNDSHPTLSTATRDPSLYGAPGQNQHDRLEAAMGLDEAAALRSASWGAFQIMGFNHEAAGYDNVYDFVTAMRESESNQLDAFVSFVQSHPGMVQALQSQDWASFASQYNGPDYRANDYDTKIAAAYARHSN